MKKNKFISLNGNTNLYLTVGFPTHQVRSPKDITEEFLKLGLNALMLPVEVFPRNANDFFIGIKGVNNIRGLVITVPFKFQAAKICKTLSSRSKLLRSVNIIRRNPDESWHGDMTDGIGFCNAISRVGTVVKDKKVLLVGAGGAGSAIALELLYKGVRHLTIYDINKNKSKALVKLLNKYYANISTIQDVVIDGFGIVAHATPIGMKKNDPLPLDISKLISGMHVGDVITKPKITSLIKEARLVGCKTSTGIEMYNGQKKDIINFFLFK